MRATRRGRRIRFTAMIALTAGLGATPATHAQAEDSFMLTSPTLTVGGTVPNVDVLNDNGCTGGNQSPPLEWRNAPPGTRGFAISIYDPRCTGPRLLALGRIRHSRDDAQPARECERLGRSDRTRCAPGSQRLRRRRIWRPLPAARAAASLCDLRSRAEEPANVAAGRPPGRGVRPRDRLRRNREGVAHGDVWAIGPSVDGDVVAERETRREHRPFDLSRSRGKRTMSVFRFPQSSAQ